MTRLLVGEAETLFNPRVTFRWEMILLSTLETRIRGGTPGPGSNSSPKQMKNLTDLVSGPCHIRFNLEQLAFPLLRVVCRWQCGSKFTILLLHLIFKMQHLIELDFGSRTPRSTFWSCIAAFINDIVHCLEILIHRSQGGILLTAIFLERHLLPQLPPPQLLPWDTCPGLVLGLFCKLFQRLL